jgi:putative acetyltransferase
VSEGPEIVSRWSDRVDEIVAVFRLTFTASEGADEGRVVSDLARDTLTRSDSADVRFFGLQDGGRLVAAVLFSRLRVDAPGRDVLMLSPMAVLPEYQGCGLGSALVRQALARLRDDGVTDVITYGDPAFYSRAGFRQIDASTLAPPHPLSQPEGWLGQSLIADRMQPVAGRPGCVAAFDRPDVW